MFDCFKVSVSEERRKELRRIELIPAVELNELICQFIISVAWQEGWRGLRANFDHCTIDWTQ